MTKKKPKTLFSHIQAITRDQDPDYWNTLTEKDKRSFSNYMIHRFLSMNEEWTELIAELQPVSQTLEPEQFYKLMIGIIPKSNTYLRYIKGKKDDAYPKWLVTLITLDFECSTTEAKDYLDILYSTKEGKKTIKYICQKYGTDPKDIKKLKLKV